MELNFNLELESTPEKLYELGCEFYEVGEYSQALMCWEEADGKNEPRAQRALGDMYKKGIGVEQSLEGTVYYYRRAAENGDIEAGYQAGVIMNLYGLYIESAMTVAKYCFGLAAEKGHGNANLDLGIIYLNEQDYEKALRHLEVAKVAGVEDDELEEMIAECKDALSRKAKE